MDITYVTALYNISKLKNASSILLNDVQDLFNCPIKLIIYVDQFYMDAIQPFIAEKSNIKMIHLPIEQLNIYNLILSNRNLLMLPESRNMEKDTVEYMALMNTKIEFLQRTYAEHKNLFEDSPYIAWIDAGISKIIKEKEYMFNKLANLRVKNLDTMLMPGCYLRNVSLGELFNQVSWVCMGGFYICHTSYIHKFHNMSLEVLVFFLINRRIAWEVNIWAEIVNRYPHVFVWYKADHNDHFLDVPEDIITFLQNGSAQASSSE